MTTPQELRKCIEDISVEMVEHGVAIQANTPLLLLQGSSILVTWSRAVSLSELFGRFATIFEYKKCLLEQDFNVMLKDGSLLQFSYTLERNRVIGHRLCYMPCPIVFDEDEAAEFSMDELIDGCGSDWQERIRLRTPVRFDFAPDATAENHPSSHMTLSEEHCRIAVSSPLSIGHLIRFVFRNFYPKLWDVHDFLRAASLEQFPSTMAVIDSDTLFVNWRRPA